MRLIDADAFKRRNERLLECDFPYISEETLEELIDDAPTIEERKKGKWMLVNDNRGQHYICNCCGEWKYHQEQNYCGHCGADMREEKTDDH